MISTTNKSSVYRDIEYLLSELTILTATSDGLRDPKALPLCSARLQKVARLLEMIADQNLYPSKLSRWQKTFAECERVYRICLESPDTRPAKRQGLIARIRSIEDLRPHCLPEVPLRSKTPSLQRARSAIPSARFALRSEVSSSPTPCLDKFIGR